MNPVCIVSMSGGKDSTATALYLRELGIPFEPVFMDTGWEDEETYRYIEDVLVPEFGVKVLTPETPVPTDPELVAILEEVETILGRRSGMARTILCKGVFPARVMRWCTEILKVEPFLSYLEANHAGRVVINATGVRAEESAARAQLAEFEEMNVGKSRRWKNVPYTVQWRPIIGWSEQDVIAIHHRHGIRPNPLYLRGASRVGCWPCIFARKSEIKRIATSDPKRIDVIRLLEKGARIVAERRAAAKGEQLRNPPAFFQNRTGVDESGRHIGRCTPIDDIVAWSKTVKRKTDIELDDVERASCMRWGMCEAAKEETEPQGEEAVSTATMSPLAARAARLNADFDILAALGWNVVDRSDDANGYEAEHPSLDTLLTTNTRGEMHEKLAKHPVTMAAMRELAGLQFTFHEGRKVYEYSFGGKDVPFETLASAWEWATTWEGRPVEAPAPKLDAGHALAEAFAAAATPDPVVPAEPVPPEPVPDPVSPSPAQGAAPVVEEPAAGAEGGRRRRKKSFLTTRPIMWEVELPEPQVRKLLAQAIEQGVLPLNGIDGWKYSSEFDKLVSEYLREETGMPVVAVELVKYSAEVYTYNLWGPSKAEEVRRG